MKPVASIKLDRLPEGFAKFKVGLRSAPYLADHGFQDLIVLPGSYYIDLALRLEREHFHRMGRGVRNVAFHNPLILLSEDTAIDVEIAEVGNGRTCYSFYEAGGENGRRSIHPRQATAALEVDSVWSGSKENSAPEFSIESFQAQAPGTVGAQPLYEMLRRNGNQYGPHFQNVAAIWSGDDQILGRLSVPRLSGHHLMDPRLLDAVTQLLAFMVVGKGKTFVLRAIERIDIADFNLPETLWGLATVQPATDPNEMGLVGSIRVFDQAGKTYLELSGVRFALLERAEPPGVTPVNIVIAANFTIEPLEDSLNFWSDHLGVPFRTEFAPYNQVFRQLLDPGSAFHRNSDGVNLLPLRLVEWAHASPQRMEPAGQEKKFSIAPPDRGGMGQRCPQGAPYVLPNGWEIVQLNQYETDYVYKEIFEEQCYLRHGIQLQDEDTVVDIGANIGLFSLFVLSRCQNPKIYAFEPAPVIYDLLKENCRVHGGNVKAVNAGVSDAAGTAAFTFYERSSVFSSFHADEAEDRQAIQAIVRNVLGRDPAAHESLEDHVNELTADRLRRQTCQCQLISLSDIIREHRIETIHLLKIDAEKSELDILKGIAEGDWPRILQIVMEIHDRTGEAVKRIEGLLERKGFKCVVDQEKLLERSGLYNLYATRPEQSQPAQNRSKDRRRVARMSGVNPVENLRRNVEDFSNALRSFARTTAAPLVICLCPSSPTEAADAVLQAALKEAEQTLQGEADTMPNVQLIGSEEWLRRYPVKDYHDPHSHDLGHIPYTPECYAAMGTAVTRAIFKLKRRPFKVIVLDCDQTLWKGVCAEDGPQGIAISPPFRALQHFMIEQMRAGMLLCLCSKNHEQDVLDVFAQRTEMPLQRDHFVAWRINWKSKSENLRSLAEELNVGLESFILVDDNPLECAEVRVHCPEVLTLQLPPNEDAWARFLDHVWAFDHSSATAEDQRRTRMYQESVQRQQFHKQALSLKSYIAGLQLRVDTADATDEQLSRVSQLTFRTNQFNLTTIRRSEQEIRDFLKSPGASCLAIGVSDRFGDYGLAGVVLYHAQGDRFKVDTFLLSCRVLGRGVEYAVASFLSRRAVGEGKQFVELTFRPTEKNHPAGEFLAHISAPYRREDSPGWTFPAEYLASLEYDPDKAPSNGLKTKVTVQSKNDSASRAWDFDSVNLSQRLQRIAEEWSDPGRLEEAMEEHRRERKDGVAPHAPGQSSSGGRTLLTGPGQDGPADSDRKEGRLPAALLDIWQRVLGRSGIGVNDNFFEVGGTSLRAVQVIARIKAELKRSVSIVSLFECPTVAMLADRLGEATDEVRVDTTRSDAALRGQQRRSKFAKRKVA